MQRALFPCHLHAFPSSSLAYIANLAAHHHHYQQSRVVPCPNAVCLPQARQQRAPVVLHVHPAASLHRRPDRRVTSPLPLHRSSPRPHPSSSCARGKLAGREADRSARSALLSLGERAGRLAVESETIPHRRYNGPTFRAAPSITAHAPAFPQAFSVAACTLTNSHSPLLAKQAHPQPGPGN